MEFVADTLVGYTRVRTAVEEMGASVGVGLGMMIPRTATNRPEYVQTDYWRSGRTYILVPEASNVHIPVRTILSRFMSCSSYRENLASAAP
jgi:hypothetical protein